MARSTPIERETNVMSDSSDNTDRIATGVPGLDIVLSGGFLRRSSTILQGAPGCGKTVLANQIAFHQASQGMRVVYVTLLTETHAALFRHLRSLSFFNAAAVGERVVYLSGFQALRESTSALLALLQHEILARRPALLVVDGLLSIQELHGSAALRQFLHELQTTTEAANCTCAMLSANADTPSPEDAVVDFVLYLSEVHLGLRSVRELRVTKSRGSPHIHGQHSFLISADGIRVFPRIEALYRTPSRRIEETSSLATFEHDPLDEMLGGGLRTASTTLVLGPTGTGKTLIGLSFLAAGMRRGEHAMHAGFYEAPPRIIASGNHIGLDLQRHVDSGLLHIDWQAPVEISLDLWGHRMLEAVSRHRPKRLFLDGFNALQDSAAYPGRIGAFLTAFLNELRALGVTTLMSAELHPIIGPGVDVPVAGVSPMVENTILLRYVEVRSHLFRLIAVLKVRGNSHQSAMREFRITSEGLQVAATFESAEAILTGSARQAAPAPPPQRHDQ